jgi:hypothetical protein
MTMMRRKKKHTPERIAKMLATRAANRASRPLAEPDIHTAIILLKQRIRIIGDKPYRDLDENEFAILCAHRALTQRR